MENLPLHWLWSTLSSTSAANKYIILCWAKWLINMFTWGNKTQRVWHTKKTTYKNPTRSIHTCAGLKVLLNYQSICGLLLNPNSYSPRQDKRFIVMHSRKRSVDAIVVGWFLFLFPKGAALPKEICVMLSCNGLEVPPLYLAEISRI
jgi:hypothetical protein